MAFQVFRRQGKATQTENTSRPPTARSLAILVVLIGAGLLGNYYTIPLFFGADFVFGSIAVLLVLYFYGLGWGMLAAVVAHGYTYLLWQHPFGVISFLCEALFVGVFLRPGRRNLVILDGIYWLLAGMPMNWLFYDVLLQMDGVTASFIMLKQGVNGVFNALLVTLAISYLPLHGLFGRPRDLPKITFRETIFNLLVIMVLLPSLLLTMLQSKHEKEELEAGIMAELQSLSVNSQLHIRSWYQLHMRAVQSLAYVARDSSMTPSSRLQDAAEALRRSFPDFHTMHVENEEGRTIAFDPPINEKGEPNLGLDFSSRFWFQEVKARQEPVVSEVFRGFLAVFSPIVNLCAPVVREAQWLGSATGTLNLERVQRLLRPYLSEKVADLTLSDAQGRIIASTTPGRMPLQMLERRETGVFQPLSEHMYLWQPGNRTVPSMTRWNQSFYVKETPMGPDLPWMLTAEAPVAPLQRVLYALYVKNLAVMAALTALALLLSHLFSRVLTRPIADLARVTANLPEKILEAGSIDWPAGSTREMDSLIGNYRSMARALEENFHEMKVQSDELRKANTQLQREIGERNQAEGALRESEARYRLISENADDVIWMVDIASRRFTYVSPSMQKLRGYTPEEVMEQLLGQGLTPESAEMLNRTLPARLAAFEAGDAGAKVRRLQIDQYRKDGSVVSTEVVTTLLADSRGRAAEMLGVARDITARKRAEQEKEKLQAQLNQAQKMESVGRLAGGVAHDFNNKLGIIMGHTEMALMKSDAAEPVHQHLTEILKASERSADLVRQLLGFARKQTVEPKVLDLNDTVSGMLKMLRRLIGEDIDLVWIPGHELWKVKIDPSQVDQILANLAVNARDAISQMGKVTLETDNVSLDEAYCATHPGCVSGEYVLLAVSDNGAGMGKDVLEHIFEPFFTTKEVGKGTGLGVSTIYGIVKQNNGYVNVYSEPGKGTCFKIYLPRFGDEGAKISLVDGKPESLSGGTETVLLVEDDAPVLKIGKAILESLGYKVLAAGAPEEAIRLAAAHRREIHLVLTDVVMPQMNGRQMVDQLRLIHPELTCLYMSGYTANVIAHHGLLEQGVHFIQKPFSRKRLAAMVREVLDQRVAQPPELPGPSLRRV